MRSIQGNFDLNELFKFQKPKTNQNKPKKSGHPTTIRAGDWVCLLCNNLNFSFRNECNRCQMQTKKNNYLQNLLILQESQNQPKLIGDNLPQNHIPNRKPLGDLTYKLINANGKENTCLKNDKKKDNVTRFETPTTSKFEENSNSGFTNLLLVTPPKNKKNYKNYSNVSPFENDSNFMKPYISPEKLPSISPIIKFFWQGNAEDMN